MIWLRLSCIIVDLAICATCIGLGVMERGHHAAPLAMVAHP